MEARLNLIAPTEDAAASMIGHRDTERMMSRTNAAPKAGSNTSTNQADNPGGNGRMLSTVALAPVSLRRAGYRAAQGIADAIHRTANTSLSDNLAPMLGTTKEGIPALVQRLQAGKYDAIRKAITEQVLSGLGGTAQGSAATKP